MIKFLDYLAEIETESGFHSNSGQSVTNEDNIAIPIRVWHAIEALAEDWRRETLKSKGIKCLRDVILVEPGEADEMVNGLIMPENTRDKPMRGTVLAVGPGKDEKPMTVKVGDVIFYSRHAGVDVIHEEKECLLMRETDVFAVL